MIRIIDYGAGNLCSVKRALAYLGYDAAFAQTPDELEDATCVILPGVGAFGDGMSMLQKAGFGTAIPETIRSGTPFLGICLGMQLLFEESYEMGRHKGFGIFPGAVEPMRSENLNGTSRNESSRNGSSLKIPHMGWNTITGTDDILFDDSGVSEQEVAAVYFVHSYFRTTDGLEPAAVCDYTRPFAAAVRQGNCLATQFHPEKSGEVGLAMLRRFLERTNCQKR